jgi:competence protein ComEC
MTSVGDAPSMAIPPRQTPVAHPILPVLQRVDGRLEAWLEAERDHLPLWLPVALGAGIAGWFAVPDRHGWIAFVLVALAIALAGVALGSGRRLGRILLLGGGAVALGCLLVWARATLVAAPVLERPTVTRVTATVERVQLLAARDSVRVVLALGDPALPPRVRVTIPVADAPPHLARGDRLRLRARLVPPPPPMLAGGYDFARAAWFQQIGATGRALGKIERIGAGGGAGLRDRLSAHVRAALRPDQAGIAVALATGDQGSVSEADAEALRRAGLAHLLSVSGLHITAVVGAAMLLTLHLLALSPRLAMAWRLPLVAAAAGAGAGIFYTWLSGAEVPTIRACIATLLVLGGLALGREAITLRLIATGALVVLLLWPESLMGASFQLSFAAVTAIVALHEYPPARAFFAARDEAMPRRIGRNIASLLLSGLAVELALAPIALFHFHVQGVFGALANIVAIPLTTFVVMPLEALALVGDLVGLGAPFWWATGQAIAALLALARAAADAPGATAMLPTMPIAAFALMVAGGLMLCLLVTRARWLGLLPFAAGAAWALATPAPDLIATGDGKHLALRSAAGGYALLRPGARDYVRRVMGEAAGSDDPLGDLDAFPGARCSPDTCVATIARGGGQLRVLATRSPYLLPVPVLNRACAQVDVVVSDRALPRGCRPRWLRLDRPMLARTGGVTITLADPPQVATVAASRGKHPWVDPLPPARARH